MSVVYLGIGSNIGEIKENFKKAIDLIRKTKEIQITKISDFYITKPVGGPKQENYLNGVIEIITTFIPQELILITKDIEKKLGRTLAKRNYPRIIDIDILFYDNLVIKREDLIIPHPRLHNRYFVLKGLFQLNKEFVHPIFKKNIEILYKELLQTNENI